MCSSDLGDGNVQQEKELGLEEARTGEEKELGSMEACGTAATRARGEEGQSSDAEERMASRAETMAWVGVLEGAVARAREMAVGRETRRTARGRRRSRGRWRAGARGGGGPTGREERRPGGEVR